MARGPDIDISPEEELRARSEAVEGAVQAAAAAGLRDSHVERLHEVIGAVQTAAAAGLQDSHVERLHEVIGRRWNVFHRALRRSNPPSRVEPLRVTLKPGARPVKARPRVYNPIKPACLATCMASLATLGLVFFNRQAVWASAAMATPKNGGVRIVSDFRAANQQVEKVPVVMPNQEASMAKLSEAEFYTSLDLLQGYWQCPLGLDAQRDLHDRHARWAVHVHACLARNFERDLLLPSDAYTRVEGLNCV